MKNNSNMRKPSILNRMGLILLLVAGSLVSTANLHAQADTTPPQLVEFSFTPTSIDVTGGDQTVVVTMRLTDELSGVADGPSAWIRSPSGQQGRGLRFARVSGDAYDGVYQGQVVFPQFSEAGTWRFYQMELVDTVGNGQNSYLGEDDLNAAGFPTQLEVMPLVAVAIDIKPGSFPNSINPHSKGVIPIAILTTNVFNATKVDPLSVRFGIGSATESHGRGHIEDANGDGRMDLVLHFATQKSGIQCGDTIASLTGNTFTGQAIVGSDSINTVGCK